MGAAENPIIVDGVPPEAHSAAGHEIGRHVLVHVLGQPDLQERAEHLGVQQRHAE